MDKETAATTFKQADSRWVVYGGIASLFLYSAFWLLQIDISKAGGGLMIFFFLLAMFSKQRGTFLREPILYVFIAWILFQFGVYLWSADTFPELREDHIREARVITYVFMFVVVAWWLGGNSKRIATMIALIALGYLIGGTFQDGGLLDELEKFDKHTRLTLGYKNWEHASVYSAFIFLSLLIFQGRITSYAPAKYKWLVRTLIYIALTYSAIAIIATQTRATWLGLLVSGAIFFCGYVIHKFRKNKITNNETSNSFSSKSLLGFGIVLVSIITLALTFNAHQLITKRLNTERDVINKLLEGNTEEVRASSIGIRIMLWDLGLEWVSQRPIAGWGPQSRKALLLESDLTAFIKNHFRHLHNTYIELLVNYGLIGLGLFAGLFIYVWFRAWQVWRGGHIPNDIMLFAGIWTIYWLIVNTFESYVIYSTTGPYLNAIVTGMLYTYHLKKRQIERNVFTAEKNSGHLA